MKNDLLGGAGEAYDTLKELADALVTNKDAITALQHESLRVTFSSTKLRL